MTGRSAPVPARPAQRQTSSPAPGGWRPKVMTVIAMVVIWCALWGSIAPTVIAIGTAVSLLILLMFPLPRMYFRFGIHPWRTVVLVSRFLWDVLVASVQVSWLAIRPRPPSSQPVVVQLVSDSDLLQALTGLAVSLVPGSLIIDADAENRTLHVHVLYGHDRALDEFAGQVRAQERRIGLALGAIGPAEWDRLAASIGYGPERSDGPGGGGRKGGRRSVEGRPEPGDRHHLGGRA